MKKIKFRSSCLLTLLAFIMVIFFLKLGFWQIHRAREKTQLLATLSKRTFSIPLSIKMLPVDKKMLQFQPIQFRGTFENQQQFLLDNQIYQDRVGYDVITPVKVKGIKKAVLVDRGWIEASQSRQTLPALTAVIGSQIVKGIIYVPLAKQFILKNDNLDNIQWPLRIQRIDFELMAKALHTPVYPFVVKLDKNAANGFIRQWQFVTMLPAEHYAYAVQWFGFAILLIIIYCILIIKVVKKKSETYG